MGKVVVKGKTTSLGLWLGLSWLMAEELELEVEAGVGSVGREAQKAGEATLHDAVPRHRSRLGMLT